MSRIPAEERSSMYVSRPTRRRHCPRHSVPRGLVLSPDGSKLDTRGTARQPERGGIRTMVEPFRMLMERWIGNVLYSTYIKKLLYTKVVR